MEKKNYLVNYLVMEVRVNAFFSNKSHANIKCFTVQCSPLLMVFSMACYVVGYCPVGYCPVGYCLCTSTLLHMKLPAHYD